MNGDIQRARVALQEATDMQPKNLRAWAMLALVQIQQDELDEVEKVTLPRMESIAGTSNNYYLQIGHAQLAMRRTDSLKGDNLLAMQRKARSHFIRASSLRPDIPGVKDMILRLDMAMNDRRDGELHARQILRIDRRHALANYILGSLRLQEGEYGEAEDFLRRSVESAPSSAALNDLAEVLRRIRRFDDAERFARQSVEKSPKLYVAWETLGVIILERGGDLNEARRCIEKAISLFKDDWRVHISLARVLIKQQEIEQARALIAEIRRNSSSLSRYDLDVLDTVSAEASTAKIKK
jgi:Flp pilus assembly protein TadD